MHPIWFQICILWKPHTLGGIFIGPKSFFCMGAAQWAVSGQLYLVSEKDQSLIVPRNVNAYKLQNSGFLQPLVTFSENGFICFA